MRKRIWIFACIVMLIAITVRADDAGSSRSQVDVLFDADSLDTLVARAKPTFAWGAGDMIWIKESATGKITFTLNQAIHPAGGNRWLLVKPKADADYIAALAGQPAYAVLDVTPAPATAPVNDADSRAGVFQTDPEIGTLYRIRWASSPMRDVYFQYRDIFLLKHGVRWRFVGEGATSASGRDQPGTWFNNGVDYCIEWLGKDDNPISIKATRWHQLAEDADVPTRADLIIRRDGMLDAGTRVMRWDSHDFLISQPGDTVDLIVERLTAWNLSAEWKKHPDHRSAMMDQVRPLVMALNPDLPSPLPPGTHIMLPDRGELAK